MHSRLVAGLALAAFVSLASASAAQPQVPGADAAADQALVDDFLAAANGSAAARADFLARRVSPAPRMPKAEFAPVLERIAGTSQGLKLESWTRGRFVRLQVVAGNGRAAEVNLDPDPENPGRLLGLIPVAAPAAYPGPKVTAAVSRDELRDGIARRVRFSAERDDFSGAVLVVKGDEVIWQGAFGQADKAAGAPVTLDTRFNLGSMDKQFTAVAIGQLIEQGKLTLDTRLVEVLPDYPNREAAEKITIRHLLSHSAGLGMLFERPGWEWKLRYSSMAELLPLFAAEPLQFEPGARGAYSNEGFVVLGAVIEKVTGRSWYDYVQEEIFDRAGMTRTGYLTDDPAIPGRAVGYKFGEDDPLGFGERRANWETLSWRGNACGGGFSTAGDMVKFLQALRDGRLLKPETAETFTALNVGGYRNYGFGFQNRTAASGRTIRGHDGGGAGSGINSDAKIVWETGYAYAVLGNYDAPFAQALGRDIADMLAAQN